jgi:hypothetical protein
VADELPGLSADDGSPRCDFGEGDVVLGIIFIPFLPAWLRSKEPLQALSLAEGAEREGDD